MNFNKSTILEIAENEGFRPETIQKVLHLLNLLGKLNEHPFLQGKLVLKGGTALNLFHAPAIHRLSVDIDLNYIGQLDRELMLEERPKIEQAMQAVFEREIFSVRRIPDQHAGGKWRVQYPSAMGGMGNLEVDLNFMFREPLWPYETRYSLTVGGYHVSQIPVLSSLELTVGKLAALFGRTRARDVFDTVELFENQQLDQQQLRLGFIVYGAMNRRDWRTISLADVILDPVELDQQLKPVLRISDIPEKTTSEEWAEQLTVACRDAVSFLFPFTDGETGFLDAILDRGEIHPEYLTSDERLQSQIEKHPLLQWKAMNAGKGQG